jgi:hypothetical protein
VVEEEGEESVGAAAVREGARPRHGKDQEGSEVREGGQARDTLLLGPLGAVPRLRQAQPHGERGVLLQEAVEARKEGSS